MSPEERQALYDAFTTTYLKAVREYTEGRPNQRSKAPWQALVDTGLSSLQGIPANEFAPKSYWLLKAYPQLEEELLRITDFLPADASMVEREFCVYHGLTERPACKHCGKELAPPNARKFRFVGSDGGKVKSGYGDYCDVKCGSAAGETIAKRRSTNIERRGVAVPAQSPEVRAKMKATMKNKHGETSFARTEKFREGARKRNLEKYGVDAVSPFSVEQVRTVSQSTMQERYGVNNAMGVQSFADKAGAGKKRHAYNRLADEGRVGDVVPQFSEDEYQGVMQDRERGIPYRYPWLCKACGTEFMDSLETDSTSGHNKPRCPSCYPKRISVGEITLREIVMTACGNGTPVLYGDRQLLNGHEVDIVVPDRHLAIEFNGLYWHSDASGGRGEKYHQDKLEGLARLGYRLLYVWEDELFEQPEAVHHVVTEACGGGEVIASGECVIVSGNSHRAITETYHREGTLGGVVTTYALKDPADRVVATLQVAQRPSKKKGVPSTAAIRYTVANGFRVPSGFKRLMDAVCAKVKGAKIFHVELDPSFDDISLHKRYGFELAHEKGVQQWYLAKPYKFRRRLGKTQLIERVSELDPTMTTKTTMTASRLQAVGADRVWGVRRQVWEYHHTPD